MDMNELLKEYNVELDEKKQELCCELQHPLLINGTTGSGKTFLLLARNAYLMKVEEVEPSAILNIVHDPAIAKRMAKDYRYLYCDDERTFCRHSQNPFGRFEGNSRTTVDF